MPPDGATQHVQPPRSTGPAAGPRQVGSLHCARVVVAAGGTLGHFMPALALVEEWRRTQKLQPLFLGTVDGPEATLAHQLGLPYHAVPAAPLFRVSRLQRWRAGPALMVGVLSAAARLQSFAPHLVVGFGGHASAGTVLAAAALGIPVVLHEANIVPGLANRMLAPLAEMVCVASEEARTTFDRAILTGVPVRPSLCSALTTGREEGAERLGLVVLGGSSGSALFNARMPAVARLLKDAGVDVRVWHQAGKGARAEVTARYAQHGVAADVDEHFAEPGQLYARAHLAVARPGAVTLSELALAGIPSVLVPLPDASWGHQAVNAAAYARSGAAALVDEDAWEDTRVADRLLAWWRAPDARRVSAAAARAQAVPDAAVRLVDACKAVGLRG